jgi:hypothetical protein
VYNVISIKAQDAAGQENVTLRTVIVDNWGPTPAAITASPDVGTHLQSPGQAQITWTKPTDGSGSASIVVSVDQKPVLVPGVDPLPTQAVSGTSYTASFPGAGTWYIHLAAKDAQGNLTLRHYGPWYVEAGTP